MHLKAANHRLNGEATIFELYDGEQFLAAIYATETGIKIVSKHLKNDERLTTFDSGFPPALSVHLR